jgi:hypothetical protein
MSAQERTAPSGAANAPDDEINQAAAAEYEIIQAMADRVAALHPGKTTAEVP